MTKTTISQTEYSDEPNTVFDILLEIAHNYQKMLVCDGVKATMATWLTIGEAAQHLKIGKSTLYQMAREGKVPAQKLGRAWRFDVDDLDRWMKSDRKTTVSDRNGA